MRRSRRATCGVVLLALVAMAGAVGLQNRMIERWRIQPFKLRDAIYLPTSDYARVVSVGYDMFMADFLWLKMIQVFAAGYTTPGIGEELMRYFHLITDLDPRFIDVYSFGILGVGEEGKRPDLVREIVEKGVVQVPAHYRVPYEGAFFFFWNMEDTDTASHYVHLAELDPECPDYIRRWPAHFDKKEGRYAFAYEKYVRDYFRAIRGDKRNAYHIYDRQLALTVDDWFREEIKTRAIEWHAIHGVYPSVDEMDRAGAFEGVELPDWVTLVVALDDAKLGNAPDDEVFAEQLVERTLRTWRHLPAAPYDFVAGGQFKGHVIWPTLDADHPAFVHSAVKAARAIQMASAKATARAAAWAREHDGQFPPDLATFVPELTEMPDPFGGAWIYDPERGVVASTTYPNIDQMHLPDL